MSPSQLQRFRKQIDKIDEQLLKILSRRFQVSHKIALLKKKNKTPILQSSREKDLLKQHLMVAKKLKLNQELIKKIFTLILAQSKNDQQRFKDKPKNERKVKEITLKNGRIPSKAQKLNDLLK